MALPQAHSTDGDSFLSKVTRYSRFVSVSKWSLGAVIVAIACAMLLIPVLRSKDDGVRIAFKGIEKREGEDKPVMINPKLQGVDKQLQPYTVTAKSARQIDADTIHLEALQADMILKDQRWLTVLAKQGTLKLKEELLVLNGNVEMYHDQGYEMKTQQVTVFLGNSSAVGDGVVEGLGPMGHIKAANFRVFDRGQRIVFNGGVGMTVYPGRDK